MRFRDRVRAVPRFPKGTSRKKRRRTARMLDALMLAQQEKFEAATHGAARDLLLCGESFVRIAWNGEEIEVSGFDPALYRHRGPALDLPDDSR